MSSFISFPGSNLRRVHSVTVALFKHDDRVLLDYIDVITDAGRVAIRLRPACTPDGYTEIYRIDEPGGAHNFPVALVGTTAGKPGPKGE